MEYFSQHGQDKYLDEEIFKGKRDGVFIDIGAFNGTAFSNTCFLERERGWKGICIEPLEHHYHQLVQNRNCICMNACVSLKEGEEDFLIASGWCEMLSGLISTYDPEHRKRIERELIDYNCSKTIKKVKTFPLQNILDGYGMLEIDYVGIDTEGSELAILQSIDFNKTKIKCFSVENNNDFYPIEKFMRKNGYRKINKLVCDEIYLKEV